MAEKDLTFSYSSPVHWSLDNWLCLYLPLFGARTGPLLTIRESDYKPKVSNTELMIGRYLEDHQYEVDTGLANTRTRISLI